MAAALTLLATSTALLAQEVRLASSDAGGVTLVLETPRPFQTPSSTQEGRVQVSLPGLKQLEEPWLPRLPYASALIGIPEGMRPVLSGVRGGSHALPSGRPEATVVRYFGLEDEEMPGVAASMPPPRGRYPARSAELAWTGWMRDLQIAEVRLYPVRTAPGNELRHHPRLEVRIDFVPDAKATPPRRERPEGRLRIHRAAQSLAILNAAEILPLLDRQEGLDGAAGLEAEATQIRAFTESGSMIPPVKITVEADGLYGVAAADLQAAGINVGMLDPRDFRLELMGQPIPVDVTGESDGVFDPGDRVVFYGKAATGRQTRRNVYWLHFDGSPVRPPVRDGTFGAPAPTPASFQTVVHREDDLIYTQNVPPGAIDHWWWKRQNTGDPNSQDLTYPITLTEVSPVPHTINLRANVQGRTGVTHHTRLFLNGPQVDDQVWTGFIPFDHSVNLASSTVSSGGNTVRMFVVGDFSPIDQVYFNFIELTYRRTYKVVADNLVAAGEGPGAFRFAFTGYSGSGILLYDVTDPNALKKISVPPGQITGSGPFDIAFQESLTTNRLYAAATVAGLKPPVSVAQDVPSNLAADPNGADWIVITPPDPAFLTALAPLVAHRQGQGYRTLVATTEDIYDEFNFGVLNTSAIEAFLDNAWANYPGAAPEFVLLAGDAHVDYLNSLGSGVPQFVPAKLVVLPTIGETPSDNEYGTTAGADLLPELSVGRLPARSGASLAAMISKLIAYETAPPVSLLNAQSTFVADNDDSAFEAILNSFASLMPPTMAANDIFMAQVGVTLMRSLIHDGFDDGSLVTAYLGHGSTTQWAAECPWASGFVAPCFSDDPNSLDQTSRLSFVASLNCINGYFIDLAAAGPGHVDYSLAESMVLAPSSGAMAAWAPAALGNISDYSSIGDWFFRNVFLDREYVLGRAATMAVISAVTQPLNPANLNNIRELTFFGDPATVLALDSDADGLIDRDEELAGTDPLDGDSDDDGLRDGLEPAFAVDQDGDGFVNGLDPDSDGDGIFDGTESGVTVPQPGTNVGQGFFVPDADPNTTTDPTDADTDGGGVADGAEDRNFNGRRDGSETDPRAGHGGDDIVCTSALPELGNVQASASGADLVLTWGDIESTHHCALYRVYVADDAGTPKDTFAPFHLVRVTGSPLFTHAGAFADAPDHDYLVVAYDPLTGQGPLGHYGQ